MAAPKALDALALVGVRLLISAIVWGSGFRAISDDDYARIVIAQRFAEGPAFDPSGTSWLPLPFWLQGFAMMLFGTEVHVARLLALAQGCASTLLVWLGAMWAGLNRTQALLAAAAASLLPYSAWLGVATVPEALTAGLLTMGACSLVSDCMPRRFFGAVALLAATLSRYEAWPVALAFGLVCVWDAYRRRQPALLALALIGVSGAALWMLHGLLHHGSATFFVKRVAAYQQALGQTNGDWLAAIIRHPLMAVRHAPILACFAGIGCLGAWRLKATTTLRALIRPLLLMGVLLAFLVLSDVRSAGATHHAERALLPLWYSWALILGATWPSVTAALATRLPRIQSILAGVALALAFALLVLLRPVVSQRAPFVDRHAELDLGERARELADTNDGRLLIDAEDYGFFAVLAGFAAPKRAVVLDDNDPRHPRAQDPFLDPEALGARLHQDRVRVLIAPTAKLAAARRFGRLVAIAGEHALIAIEPKHDQ